MKYIEAKNMFAGITHLYNGNMFRGIYKDFLVLRLGEAAGIKVLKRKHIRLFDITGKPMKGGAMVESKTENTLKTWLIKVKESAKTLPKKQEGHI